MEKEETFPGGKACCWQGIELWLRVSKVIFLFRHRFPLLSCTRLLRLCAWAEDKNMFLPLTAVMTIYHMLFKEKSISSLCTCLWRERLSRQADIAYNLLLLITRGTWDPKFTAQLSHTQWALASLPGFLTRHVRCPPDTHYRMLWQILEQSSFRFLPFGILNQQTNDSHKEVLFLDIAKIKPNTISFQNTTGKNNND